MNKNLTLIKLGGGLIAPKEWGEETADLSVIRRLVEEIKESGRTVVVVSGSGNFGHTAVRKYGIATLEGVRKVRKSAGKIGEIVAKEMRESGFQTQLIAAHKFFGKKADWDLNMTPVFYGDVMDLPNGGWMVYSGEKIIELLVPILSAHGRKVEKIIQVSKEQGVMDENGTPVPVINTRNWKEIKKNVSGAAGTDVTGGMLHKVEESLEIARRYKVETVIISGKIAGRLREALSGAEVSGTMVR